MFLPANITLQFGDSGDFVAELQRRLSAIDAHGHDGINGFYDGVTVNSVSGFQSRVGIRADGIAGPETLRRLNGVMSGESDTAEDKKEEEEKQLAADQAARTFYHLDQEPGLHTPLVATIAAEEAIAAEISAAADPALHSAHSAAPTLDAQQQLQQQLLRDTQFQHDQLNQGQPQPQPVNGDMLAQLLLQQTEQSAQQTPPIPSTAAQASSPEALPLAAVHPAPALHPAPAQRAAAPVMPIPVPAAPAAVPAALAPEPAEPQRGLVARAIQKFDAFMQRLADHFETKLPPDVLREVREAGHLMIASGVREAAIPSGPENVRGPATPARSPDQQQIPLRG